MANKLDAEKLRALDEATKPSGIGLTVREFAAEIVRRSKAAEELADCLVSSLPTILAMADEIERLRAIVARTMTDHQRLLWRDDVEGICPTPGVCWEYGDTARCGPCAIKQASKCGVEASMSLPNLPDVYRLRRHCTAMEKAITAFLPRSVAIDNATWADGTFIPLDTSLGELRALKTARDAYLKEHPRNAD